MEPRILSSTDRRDFLKLLGLAAAGSVVAYSFPSIIVPQNIVAPGIFPEFNPSTHVWDVDAILAAQREYIDASIRAFYANESNFLKRLQETIEPTNFRGRRVPLLVSPFQ